MATFSTRIYVKVDSNELMKKLGTLDISDLGKGFYSAKELFTEGTTENYFCDNESALNEFDVEELVTRVAAVIQNHGVILADTFSYDYDPLPTVCFFNGKEPVCKLLEMDGEEFQTTVDIRNISEWISFVEDAEDVREADEPDDLDEPDEPDASDASDAHCKEWKLTYTKKIRYENEKYSIAIPDGFQLHTDITDRDFEAWAEDADENVDSPITFYAGAEIPMDMENEQVFTPLFCSALAEMTHWQIPITFKAYAKSKFIPLNEKIPAGGISAGYDSDNFSYNISVFMKGCMKRMRVQFLDVTEEDIETCDKLVVDWIKSMELKTPIGDPKPLDDPSFYESPLTEELVNEWQLTSDSRFTTIAKGTEIRISASRARLAGTGDNSKSSLQQAVENILHDTAIAMGSFLRQGCSGLRKILEKNPDEKLMNRLFNVLRPAVMDERTVSTSIDGGYSDIEEEIPGIDEIRAEFLAMDKREETAAMAKKETVPVFSMPTYEGKRTMTIGTMSCKIPDRMLTLEDAVPGDNVKADLLPKLQERYSLVAVPQDFEKGLNAYGDGAFCLNLGMPQTVAGFAALFDKKTQKNVPQSLVNTLTSIMKRNGFYNEEYPVRYVKGDDEYGVVAAQTQGGTDKAKYMFLVLHLAEVMQGNIYINAKGTQQQFDDAAYGWLNTFRISDKELEKRIRLKQQKKEAEQKRREEAERRKEIERQKKAEAEQRKALLIEKEKTRLKTAINEEHDKAISAAKAVIAEQEAKKAEIQKELDSLGFFGFLKRGNLEKMFLEATATIEKAEADIKTADSNQESALKSAEQKLRSMEILFRSNYYLELLDADKDNMTSWQKDAARCKKGILDYLLDGSEHTISEMMENVPALKDASNQKAASMVRQLADDKILTRREIMRKAYFSINKSAL